MIIAEWYHIPTGASLGFIGLVLAVSIWLSIGAAARASPKRPSTPWTCTGELSLMHVTSPPDEP